MESTGRAERIRQLFLEAGTIADSEREEWLCGQCAGDDELLSEVRSLLDYDDLPIDPLEGGLALASDEWPRATEPTQVRPAVSGYRIVREIDSGGQAIVYEAIQESTTQRVALKLLRWGQSASSQERERLRREVVILAQLSHPGIVSIIDCGETKEGVFFIVTKFVDGHRLDELLHPSETVAGLLGLESAEGYQCRVLRLFQKVCNAVEAAHQHGVVHRDLKPGNILIDRQGEPRVLDFGLAKANLRGEPDETGVQPITVSGQFMGSLPWASPEQAAGESVDARSDVYSLGVLLYQLLSGGQFPYNVSGRISDVISRIIRSTPTPLDRISRPKQESVTGVKNVDRDLNGLVMKALSKPIDCRYQTAGDMGEAISKYLEGNISGKPNRRSMWGRAWLFVAAGVALVAFLLASPYVSHTPDGRATQARPPSEQSGGMNWQSLISSVSALVDGESVSKADKGWRIRHREIRFPELRSESLIVEIEVQRYSRDPLAFRLECRDGNEIRVNVNPLGSSNTDRLEFSVRNKLFVMYRSEQQASEGVRLELGLAVLPDRVTFKYGGQVLAQLHTGISDVGWTPVIDSQSSDIDCLNIRYAKPTGVPRAWVAEVATSELPAVDYVVREGGAALSQSFADSDDGTFHVSRLSTEGVSRPVSASELERIAACESLTQLTLHQIRQPHKAVEHISKLTALTDLSIAHSRLGGDCFHHLAKLKQLESLSLYRTQIAEPDFRPLRQLQAFERLWAESVSASDADLGIVAEIKSLRKLALDGDKVTSQGVRSLLRQPKLEWIELCGAQISGDGMRYLSELPSIWQLNLSGTDTSDDDVPHLADMTKLRRLTLKNTRLTLDGVDQLRSALPYCTIEFDRD